MKQDTAKADKEAAVGHAVAEAVNSFLDTGRLEVEAREIWDKASELAGFVVSPVQGGRVLAGFDVEKRQNFKGKYLYDLSVFLEENNK